MNAQQWRKKGWHVIFRSGAVYLYNAQFRNAYHTAVNHGAWMRYDDLNERPWIHHPNGVGAALARDLMLTADACYCNSCQGNSCDFCAGIRSAEDAA